MKRPLVAFPFEGTDSVSVAVKQVNEMPAAPRSINPDIDPVLEAIILKAMEKDPAQRFANAQEMRQALNDYLAGRPVPGLGVHNDRTQVLGAGIPSYGWHRRYAETDWHEHDGRWCNHEFPFREAAAASAK